RALVNGKIREKFEEYRKPNGRHIRIQLQFADEDLASLPWEYMFYYRERTPGYYLSEKVDLTLSRFMPPPMDLQEAEELRLLLVFSKTDDDGFDNDVADKLFDALGIRDKSITPDVCGDYCCVSFDGRVKITICQQPTYSRLSKYLSDVDTPFHIVHFVGQ